MGNGMLKDLLPPLLWGQLRRAKVLLSGGHPMYEPHVFMSPEEIPSVKENVWASENWIESQHIVYATKAHGPEAGLNDHGPLNVNASALLLASMISLQKTDPHKMSVRILDIGGGLSGGFYLAMQRHFSSIGVKLTYAVVDGRLNCELGRDFFHAHPDLRFFDFEVDGLGEAAKCLGPIDACNISSALQYIIDWRFTIASIASLRPRAIVISRTPFPDHAENEAYAIQHVSTHKGYCGRARVVMIPRAILVQEMEQHGYDCWAEHGTVGDASWYWQAGCKRKAYFSQTNRSFVFVRRDF